MNIISTKKSPAASSRPQQQSMTRDDLVQSVTSEMEQIELYRGPAKLSGHVLLNDLKKVEGKNLAEITTSLKGAESGARTREKVGKWLHYGGMALTILGPAAVIATMDPASGLTTLLGTAGVGASTMIGGAVLAGVSNSQASQHENTAQNLQNWTDYLESRDQVPDRPKMETPISRDDFLKAVELHSAAPHPTKEFVEIGADGARNAFSQSHAKDTGKLKTELTDAVNFASTEGTLSKVQVVMGAALTVGSLVAGLTGHIPPLYALGGGAAGLVIAKTGETSIQEFSTKHRDAQSALDDVQGWETYLSGRDGAESPKS